MTVAKLRSVGFAASLVASPLLIFAYWLLYPAYGELHPVAMLRDITAHAATTTAADICIFLGVFLAVPATLAQMRVLGGKAPRLTLLGGVLSMAGWIALVGVLMGDVLATQMASTGTPPPFVELFERFMGSPFMIALTVVATMHVVGGVLLGIALFRTQLIPRWAGLIVAITPVIHLGSNIAGLFLVDEATWLALAVAYLFVARAVIQASADGLA